MSKKQTATAPAETEAKPAATPEVAPEAATSQEEPAGEVQPPADAARDAAPEEDESAAVAAATPTAARSQKVGAEPEDLPQWQIVLTRDCLGKKAGDTVGFMACESPNGVVDAVRTDHAKAVPIER